MSRQELTTGALADSFVTNTVGGSDSYTLSEQGGSTFTQMLLGSDQLNQGQLEFAISEFADTSTGSDTFSLDDRGSSYYSVALDDTGSWDNGTDSYTQSQTGSESFTQYQQGQDISGVYVTSAVTADSTVTSVTDLFDASSDVTHYRGFDDLGSTEDIVETASLHMLATASSTAHAEYGLDASSNLVLNSYRETDTSQNTVFYSVDNTTDTWLTYLDSQGSYDQGVDMVNSLNGGNTASNQYLKGHGDTTSFTVDTLTVKDSGTNGFLQEENSTEWFHTAYAGGTDDTWESIAPGSWGNETFTRYQAGHDDTAAGHLRSRQLHPRRSGLGKSILLR